MKICKLRIIDCSLSSYWYRNMVGQEVYASRGTGQFDFREIHLGERDRNYSAGYFKENDITIIEEFDGELVETTVVSIVKKGEKVAVSSSVKEPKPKTSLLHACLEERVQGVEDSVIALQRQIAEDNVPLSRDQQFRLMRAALAINMYLGPTYRFIDKEVVK